MGAIFFAMIMLAVQLVTFGAFADVPADTSIVGLAKPDAMPSAVAAKGTFSPQHALSLYGTPKYPATFQHFDYVNPDAPKGGAINLASLGGFDSLNGFILKGEAAAGLDYLYDTLMTGSLDEPFTQYGLLAESVEVKELSERPEVPGRITPSPRLRRDLPGMTTPTAAAPVGGRTVTFTLRPEAKWQDGEPITPADVIFTFNTLRTKGHPSYRSYFADVASVAQSGPRAVTFTLKPTQNRELPMILGGLPILPAHYWAKHDFSATTLTAPLGSGPYKIQTVDAPRRITYTRDPDYWGRNLPVNTGRYNFDTLNFDYYRDSNVLLQAFFAGAIDLHQENVAKDWATSYQTKPVLDGRIKKEEITHHLPAGMQAFVMNLRKPVFQDRRVREALNLAFDFEWANKHVAFGAYTRTQSFFENSDLAARALPSADELKLLEPYRDQLPPEVFTSIFHTPQSDGSGDNRANLRRAKQLLEEAGYTLHNGVMVKDGQPLEFEVLLVQDAFLRWLNPLARNLEKIGVRVNIRVIDTAQLQRRQDQFDFDMLVGTFPQSNSPGNEQRDMWMSARAETKGSRNLMGLKSPVVDMLVGKIVSANSLAELQTACRALDRVLSWGYYVIPNWYINNFRVAYWNKFGRPAVNPPYGLPIVDTWWSREQTSRRVDEKKLQSK